MLNNIHLIYLVVCKKLHTTFHYSCHANGPICVRNKIKVSGEVEVDKLMKYHKNSLNKGEKKGQKEPNNKKMLQKIIKNKSKTED